MNEAHGDTNDAMEEDVQHEQDPTLIHVPESLSASESFILKQKAAVAAAMCGKAGRASTRNIMKKMKEPLVEHEKGKEKERTLPAKEGDLENFTTEPQPTSPQ
jgi:hypothetical protein